MTAALEQTPAVHLQGLSQAEVAQRCVAGEVNTAPPRATRTYRQIILHNLFPFLNLLIFSIAAVLLVLGLYTDAALTSLLGLVNALVATVQEVRAKWTIDRIAILTRPVATVIREGQEASIAIDQIVRGDLIVVRAGGQIVVDGPVLTTAGLNVDESLLTGESELVAKRQGETLYSGTYAMSGMAVYRAEKIGDASTAEQINGRARAARTLKTPLQREIDWLMRGLLVVILLLAFQVLGTFSHLSPGFSPNGSVTKDAARAIAVLVGLVPQGLVLMISVAYALGIVRLARKGILARQLNAVESLSHVDVLCLDKTGTLTTNNLNVQALHPLAISVSDFERLLGDFVRSSTSSNRTSEAISRACAGEALPVLEETPFDSERKWSGLVFGGARAGASVLGAPEVLLPALAEGADALARQAEEWAEQGLRVLLFAHSATATTLTREGRPRLPGGLHAVGLIVLSDELRADAGETIRGFAEDGIVLKIISGDHAATVTALARQAGIAVTGDHAVVTGAELENLDEAGYERIAEQATIFARVTPRQKEELVRALQRKGHYVAMTGDGVNDVPALKCAQVGIAMRSGSDVTRDVADLVLLDDSFASLPATFREGQRIRNGLKTSVELFLTRVVYTTLIIFATASTGQAFPVELRHGALISMLAVGMPAFALTVWARPGPVDRRVLPAVLDTVAPAGLTIAAAGLIVYQEFLTLTDDVRMAQSALTILTVVCGVMLILFLRPPTPLWAGRSPLCEDLRPALFAVAMLIAFFAVLVLSPLQGFWELEPLPFWAYPVIAQMLPLWAWAARTIWRQRWMPRGRSLLVQRWQALRKGRQSPPRQQTVTS